MSPPPSMRCLWNSELMMGVVTTTRLSLPEVEQLDQQQPNLVGEGEYARHPKLEIILTCKGVSSSMDLGMTTRLLNNRFQIVLGAKKLLEK
ncbi:hypothetical protein CY35_06G026000 [Sphagnum magellanicum]|nr:hypothetical protein CY35_06G026000 [Sphagnum magellanicum]